MLWFGFLVFASVVLAGEALSSSFSGRKERLAAALGAAKESPLDLVAKGPAPGVSDALSGAARLFGRFFPKSSVEGVALRLERAGNPLGLTPEQFLSSKVVVAAVLAGAVLSASLVSGMKGSALALSAGAAGYILPDLLLNARIDARKRKIESSLLPFIDLLAVACESGLSLNEAVSRVAEGYPGVLADEWRRTLREVDLGRPKAEAFDDMAKRCGSQDLSYLLTALSQAERHGTPVVDAVKEESRHLRRLRQTRAQEFAQKSSVKMLVPVVLFMFLPMVVLVVGPALLNLMEALGF